jgi:hypothetical protein
MKCKYCQQEFIPSDKPYLSKQAGMEGEYHWNCFVEACRNRIPVGIGVIAIPHLDGDDDEPSHSREPAGMEEE